MKKNIYVVMAAAMVVVMAMTLLLTHNSSEARKSTTLTVVERATTDKVIEAGGGSDALGNLLTFANEVFDEKNETKVGTDNGYCVRTNVGVAWECIWTVTLADGQLTVEGSFLDTGDSVFAITGGSGAYQNARGQMTLKWRNPEGTEYDFIYEIND